MRPQKPGQRTRLEELNDEWRAAQEAQQRASAQLEAAEVNAMRAGTEHQGAEEALIRAGVRGAPASELRLLEEDVRDTQLLARATSDRTEMCRGVVEATQHAVLDAQRRLDEARRQAAEIAEDIGARERQLTDRRERLADDQHRLRVVETRILADEKYVAELRSTLAALVGPDDARRMVEGRRPVERWSGTA